MLEHITINPADPVKKTIIWMHGLGADGHDFAPIAKELNLPHTRFIFPHAPVQPVSLNGGYAMPAWFDIHGLDINSRIDWPGLEKAKSWIQELMREQNKQGIEDKDIFLAGFSQGGVVALYTGLCHPTTISGIIGLSTFLPIHHPMPLSAMNQATPILLAHGDEDPIVPFTWGQMVAEWLKTRQYSLSWHTYSMAHQVCPEEINDLRQWFTAHR